MEDIVETKGIEKVEEIKVEEAEPKEEKPKRKPRTEAQKAAFEKARKKRAENLAKKKEEEKNVLEEEPFFSPEPTQALTEKKQPKKRGRPKGSKKLKREPVPEAGQPNFLPRNTPPDAGDLRYQYQQTNPYQFNPMMMYQQQFQPPPQVHNYYYGHQQPQSQPQLQQPPSHAEQRPPTPEVVEESSEEEVEQYVEYPQDTYQEPQLRYRFA